jgi:dolichol-phosphate mannosyltransferase
MGGDLQDPPESLPDLVHCAYETQADLVVGAVRPSRIDRARGSRRLRTQIATRFSRLLFRESLEQLSDPLSGFFLLRKSAIEAEALRPRGHRILLEIIARNPGLRLAEVSVPAGERTAGASKANVLQEAKDIVQLTRLRLSVATTARAAHQHSAAPLTVRPLRRVGRSAAMRSL